MMIRPQPSIDNVEAAPRVCPRLEKPIITSFQNYFIEILKQNPFPTKGEHTGSPLQKSPKKASWLLAGFMIISSAWADDATIKTPNANQPVETLITLPNSGKRFRAVLVNPAQVTLHWKNAAGRPYRYFSTLKKALEADNKRPLVLMNAGIYDKNDQPAGLHIENGNLLKKLNTHKGGGNFHLQPNGVFFIDKKNRARIVTTAAYKKHHIRSKTIRLATQSGPMMLINGRINSKFIPDSRSFYSRTGICTTPKNRLYFLSTAYMTSNFYQFAQAAKRLGCHNALYLDGNIAKLYTAGENSTFHFVPLVGILSVTATP